MRWLGFQATEDVQQGLTQDDFDMYYEVWERFDEKAVYHWPPYWHITLLTYIVVQRFDEKATQYIAFDQLSEFVDTLEEPLRIPAPNLYKLVTMNIPICIDDRVHCVDILDALTKNFLGTADDEGGDLADIAPGPERKDYQPIGSTLQRQRQIYCVRIIQKAWRRHQNPGGEEGDRECPSAVPDAAADGGESIVVDVDAGDVANDWQR